MKFARYTLCALAAAGCLSFATPAVRADTPVVTTRYTTAAAPAVAPVRWYGARPSRGYYRPYTAYRPYSYYGYRPYYARPYYGTPYGVYRPYYGYGYGYRYPAYYGYYRPPVYGFGFY